MMFPGVCLYALFIFLGNRKKKFLVHKTMTKNLFEIITKITNFMKSADVTGDDDTVKTVVAELEFV